MQKRKVTGSKRDSGLSETKGINRQPVIKGISHIGIAVKNLDTASKVYSKLLQQEPFGEETVEEQKVKVVKFKAGNIILELLEPTNESSAIHKFILKHGEGIHHISYESDDIKSDIKRLKDDNFNLIYDKEVKGSGNSLIT